jgi:hypothetical protein
LNTKVVDLAILYHFQKGYIGFFSTEFAKTVANFECQPVFMNRRCWPWSKFFMPFHSKFELPIYMKVVSLNTLDNFPKGRILSV